MPKMRPKMRWAWHVHHEALAEIVEPGYSLASRRRYIKQNKPVHEQELRLRLIKYVKGRVPEKVTATACREGWTLKRPIVMDGKPLLDTFERLHKKECPGCPWDGKTIFPGQIDARLRVI